MTAPTAHVLATIRTTTTTTEIFTSSSRTTTLTDVSMKEEKMDVVVAKIISLLILTVLSVLSGLLPLRLLMHAPHLFTRNRQPTDYFLCGLRLFSGGIYLATCFLHLLPDTRKKIDAVMVNMGSMTTYAVPELLIISGFYAVVFVEQIIKALYVKAQMTDTNRKKKPKRALKNKENRPQVFRSTLEEEGFQCSHFKMDDDCHDNRNKRHSGSNYDDDDDDDDDDNVLVEDDDDLSFDSDSDQHSEGSYTCVKQSFQDKSADYDDSTLRHNRVLQNGPGLKSASYTDALKQCSLDIDDRDNEHSNMEITAIANKADNTSKAATVPVSVTTVSPAVVFKTPQSSQPDKTTTTPSIIGSPPASLKPSVMKKPGGIDETYHNNSNSNSRISFPVHSANQDKSHHSLNHYYQPPQTKQQSNCDQQAQKSASEIIEPTKDQSCALNQVCDDTSNHQIRGSQYVHQSYDKSSCNHTTSPYPNISHDSDSNKEVTQDRSDENSLRRVAVSIETDGPDLNGARDKDVDSGIFSSKRDCEDYLSETIRLKQMGSSEASIDRISEHTCSLQDIQIKRVVEELTREDLSRAAHFRSIIYIMALSFHGIFEGMALGLQSMKSSVWALCFAIVVHRCVLAFKLGMDLCRGEEKQGTSFLCIGTFTLISTLGIIVGILISSGAALYSDVTVPEAILQSLATGTIFYIVFLDIVFKDLQGKDDLKRVSCFFVGFSVMAIVFAVTSS